MGAAKDGGGDSRRGDHARQANHAVLLKLRPGALHFYIFIGGKLLAYLVIGQGARFKVLGLRCGQDALQVFTKPTIHGVLRFHCDPADRCAMKVKSGSETHLPGAGLYQAG